MAIERVQSAEVPEPPPETWSNCLVAGDRVFIAGMTARGADFKPLADMDEYEQRQGALPHQAPSGGERFSLIEQARACLIKKPRSRGSMADIVRVNIFVTDIRNREEVWRARREFFSGDFPVSTLVEVSALAAPEMTVEIEAEGVLGGSAAG